MGKRSLPDQRRFWGSALCAVATWAGLAALPVLGAWGLRNLLQTPENLPSPAVVSRSPASVSRPAPSPFLLPITPPPAPEPLPPAPSPAGTPPPGSPRDALASIRLQVLNGSGVRGLAARAAQVLRDAGCRVVATLPAREHYAATVILYQPGNDGLAGEVAKLLGASRLRPAPPGLDRTVEVTVVVGADYRG